MGLFWSSAKEKAEQAERDRAARFNQVMQLAKSIVEIDPKGLLTLTRLVAAPLQAATITSAAHAGPHSARAADSLGTLFFPWGAPVAGDHRGILDVIRCCNVESYRFRLGRDPLIATPWHRTRLAYALATIGAGKSQGAWSQDSNHQVTVLLPFGLGLVNGGNHSIAAGIANVEGYIDSTETLDLSPLYDLVGYDGNRFVRLRDRAVLSEPEEEVPGMLFEIGRLMLQHGIGTDMERVG